MMEMVAIITPLYKATPSATELASLRHGFAVLSTYKRYIVMPDTLDLSGYEDVLADCDKVRLPASHFASVASYNRLMLSKCLYERFADFEYLLIFQPDAYIFRDDLADWCDRGFDYIGAPWPNGEVSRPFSFRGDHLLAKILPWFNRPILRKVGNGGLSLRRVASAISTLERHWFKSRIWVGNEDLFWSLYSPKVADEQQASLFALEENPSSYYKANGNRLPFGCHAWEKHEPEFWRTQIELSRLSKSNAKGNKC